ncbi:MAG: hypothetical protein V2I50_06785 [Desulfuromusa sp.]|jgi:hypothetical protein|nr:hypothetical protein [Desulfuromusa sp.]
MPLLPTEKLQPLMVLSADLHDRTGRLLAAKGTVLTPKHFLVFKTWGIKEADVIDEQSKVSEENADSEETTALVEATIEELKPLFCHTNLKHPFIIELLHLVAQKKVMKNDA